VKIELRDHPGKRHVQISKSDRRYLFTCAKCHDDTVEPHNRTPGRPVRCETCGEKCEPKLVSALPHQHGIYVEGKCVGYCTKETDPEVWFVEKLDPYVIESVNKVILAQYGGESLVHEKPEWPDDAPAEVEEVDTDIDDEEGDE
jgi:hypothetical protein